MIYYGSYILVLTGFYAGCLGIVKEKYQDTYYTELSCPTVEGQAYETISNHHLDEKFKVITFSEYRERLFKPRQVK